MKKINRGFLLLCLIVLLIGGTVLYLLSKTTIKQDRQYLIEVNRINRIIEDAESDQKLMEKVEHCKDESINEILFLGKEESEEAQQRFFNAGAEKKGDEVIIEQLTNKNLTKTFVRYEYPIRSTSMKGPMRLVGALIISIIVILSLVYSYIRIAILKPFCEIEQMPIELSKGKLNIELKENKNRYFGKFLWGLDLLREELRINKQRQLQLEREKKLMILTVSHDIKTPLSSLSLYARALTSGLYKKEEKKQEIYGQIQSKVDEINQFVKQIEEMSTKELLHISVTKEEHYLNEVIAPVEQAYKEKLALLHTEFTIQHFQNHLVYVDVDRIYEVFDNLIENALKYGDGRKISIEFEEQEYCQLIHVRNTGDPIDEKAYSHIFDSFYRGENAKGKKGSGLGLYICREIMKKLEGDIFVTNEQNGVCFTLVLQMYS